MTTRVYNRMIVLAATLGLAAIALGEIPDPPDPVESEIAAAEVKAQWIRRVTEASNLMGEGKAAEALAAFEALQREMPALDENGVVALAIGDCQFQLKQYEKAQATYEQASQAHPDLVESAWLRLVETQLSMGRLEEAASRVREVLKSDTSPSQKAWAYLRQGNIEETQAIQLLDRAEQTYRQATGIFSSLDGQQAYGRRWSNAHADDLRDASTQLQAALGQLMEGNRMLVCWQGPSRAAALPVAEVAKVRISGQVSQPQGEKDGKIRSSRTKAASQAMELVVEKDGKVEVTVEGRKVELDDAAQRQILNHLQHAMRIAGQRSDPELDARRVLDEVRQAKEQDKN